MKYTPTNTPVLCIQSETACYKGTKPMTVRGVLWHSTGANNPELRRYIQPADNDPNRQALLDLIGVNKYGNDYNHGNKDRQMGMNAWIGKLADGTVSTLQTLPFGWKPWGCGAGSRGSCNDGWIQFEICEDGLTDPVYAEAVYREACELTAFLCQMYHLDPHGRVVYKGIAVPVILDHKMSHTLGLGNNHGDVQHWFPKLLGKTLEDIRNDVAALMAGKDVPEATPDVMMLVKGSTGDAVKALQRQLVELGYNLGSYGPNKDGCDGQFGSATESAVKDFQVNHNMAVTGIVTEAVRKAVTDALAALDMSYTVVIKGLSRAKMEALRSAYPSCEVTEE